MKKSPTTTTAPVVKLEQAGGTTSTASGSVVGGTRPIPLLDPTMSTFSRMNQPMGPPTQPPPAGYRSIYNNNTSNPIMVLPRTSLVNTQLPNPLLSRRATAPIIPGTTGAADEKASYDDVLTFTGVDLKEETDNILRENELLGARQSAFATQLPDRSRTQSFLDQRKLANLVTSIAMQHKMGLSPDVMTYLALAAQERIRALVESMIAAKNHRIHSEHIHHPSIAAGAGDGENLPMYKEAISLDVKSQLLAIEKVEREQERKRKEIRAGLKNDNKAEDKDDLKDQQSEATTSAPKRSKRQKRDTLPMPAIHKLTVDTKNTNMTALSAAGGKTKSWMIDIQPEVLSTPVINDVDIRSSRARSSRSTLNTKNYPTVRSQQAGGSTTNITNPYTIGQQQQFNGPVPTITVKDALFVLERDRGGGGGAGSGREVLMKGYVKWLR